MDETDNLCNAASVWISAVLPRLSPGQRQVFDAMLQGRCDIAVEVRLRDGTVKLMALEVVQGRYTVLFREDVAPLRPAGHAPVSERSQ